MLNIKQIQKPVGSLEILVHLHSSKKATVTELLRDAGLNQRTTYSALENLQENGLIAQELGNGFPLCKYYGLTDKGKPVARTLERVEKLLEADNKRAGV